MKVHICILLLGSFFLSCARDEGKFSSGPADESIQRGHQQVTFQLGTTLMQGLMYWRMVVKNDAVAVDELYVKASGESEGYFYNLQGRVNLLGLGQRQGNTLSIQGDREPSDDCGSLKVMRARYGDDPLAFPEIRSLGVVQYDVGIQGSAIQGELTLHELTDDFFQVGRNAAFEQTLTVNGVLAWQGCTVYEPDTNSDFDVATATSHWLCSQRLIEPTD